MKRRRWNEDVSTIRMAVGVRRMVFQRGSRMILLVSVAMSETIREVWYQQ